MSSTQIKLQIVKCERKIEKNCVSIKEAEHDYETLTVFKQNVVSYQASFSSSNNGKIQALESVSQIVSDCETASRYYKGMKVLVNTSVNKIINFLLEKLIASAQDSMRSYMKEISDWENENVSLKSKIERLQQDLKIAEMNEALADANK